MTATIDAFHELVGQLDYSMFIVTTVAAGERSGCLVGFASQVSIDPPRFLACLSQRNRTHEVAERAGGQLCEYTPSRRAATSKVRRRPHQPHSIDTE